MILKWRVIFHNPFSVKDWLSSHMALRRVEWGTLQDQGRDAVWLETMSSMLLALQMVQGKNVHTYCFLNHVSLYFFMPLH